jgi:hypothetical protein
MFCVSGMLMPCTQYLCSLCGLKHLLLGRIGLLSKITWVRQTPPYIPTTLNSLLSPATPRFTTSSHSSSFVYLIKAQNLPPAFRTRCHLFLRRIGHLFTSEADKPPSTSKVNAGQVPSPITLRDRMAPSSFTRRTYKIESNVLNSSLDFLINSITGRAYGLVRIP